jgi:hypothetical protein
MSADITPEQARSETIENLIRMANMYKVGYMGSRLVMKYFAGRGCTPTRRSALPSRRFPLQCV